MNVKGRAGHLRLARLSETAVAHVVTGLHLKVLEH